MKVKLEQKVSELHKNGIKTAKLCKNGEKNVKYWKIVTKLRIGVKLG